MRPAIAPVTSVLDDVDALVPPTFWHCPDYVETLGPEVGELNRLFGFGPNPEQQLLHDATFGLGHAGRFTAFEIGLVAARQNFKTGYLIQRANGKALLLKRPLQVWTAHKESATDQAFAEFMKMLEASSEYSKRVRSTNTGKGSKEIIFTNGCRIVFRPRTGKAGQSMSADDVDFDEYFAAEPKHEGSLVPTMSTRPNAQLSAISSAPHTGSNLQRRLMKRGRLAALGLSSEPRLVYAEWSSIRVLGENRDGSPRFGPLPCRHENCTHQPGSDGCIADDREVIKLANPSAGRSAAPSISWDYLDDERRRLQGDSLEEYIRERLSIGVEDAEASESTLFGPRSVWEAGETTSVPDGLAAVGVALTADRSHIALVGASLVELEDESDPEAEPVDRLIVAPILHTTDVAAALTHLRELQEQHDAVVSYDERGPAAPLFDDPDENDPAAEIAAEPMNLTQYANASSKFNDRVTVLGADGTPTPTLLHLANDALDDHVARAEWRWVGDNRIISRRDGSDANDVTLLEAAVIAARQAELVGSTFTIA
jgi:hypothetical protein